MGSKLLKTCLEYESKPIIYFWFLRIAALKEANIKSEMRSFKSNENIHKKEGGSYYVVSANKASSVTQ